VDGALGQSLGTLAHLRDRAAVAAASGATETLRALRAECAALALDHVLPGYPAYELKVGCVYASMVVAAAPTDEGATGGGRGQPHGAQTPVTLETLGEFIEVCAARRPARSLCGPGARD
jgi:hypothetical protein